MFDGYFWPRLRTSSTGPWPHFRVTAGIGRVIDNFCRLAADDSRRAGPSEVVDTVPAGGGG